MGRRLRAAPQQQQIRHDPRRGSSRAARCIVGAALAAMALLGRASPARAEYLDTTTTLASGQLSLAAEFMAGLGTGLPLLLNFHESIGLLGGFDLWLREGIPLTEPRSYYVGAGIKWTILRDRPNAPGLALWAGGHFWSGASLAGANIALLVDHHFSALTPYAGLGYDLDFGNGEAFSKLRLLAGTRIHIHPRIGWFVEGGLGLLGDPKPHFISTGPRVTI